MKKYSSKKHVIIPKSGRRLVVLGDGQKVVKKVLRSKIGDSQNGKYRMITGKEVDMLLRKRDESLVAKEVDELNNMSRFIEETFK
ncbi:hypothetical protein [Pedobacter sp. Leaf176]|uniref:hypothetical protein n=1 Tax=Pedobacter sp. Leaf176 TaxID=1736286 RepID=UPI0007002190|nr:hypothetical protein [Pedobacter sp. Leaf176]KQR71210.1 hypothetical protein ASF92_07435 [Pedobacter sp. Leaf176]